MDSNFLKKVSIFVFVLGAISTIAAAVVYGKETVMGLYEIETRRSAQLTVTILISGFIGTGLLGIIFASISNVLDYLECIYEKMEEDENREKFNASKPSDFSNSRAGLLDETGPKGDWECQKCGHKNSVSDLVCKDCGTYK